MKIACLALDTGKVGGTATYSKSMYDMLYDKTKHHIDFFELAGTNKKRKALYQNEFSVINYRDKQDVLSDYDIIHILSWKDYNAKDREKEFVKDALSKTPWIFTMHGQFDLKSVPCIEEMIKIPTCVGYCPVRKKLGEFFGNSCLSSLDYYSVGIFANGPQKSYNAKKDSFVFAGRLSSSKGIKEFIKLAQVTKRQVHIFGNAFGVGGYKLLQSINSICSANKNIEYHNRYTPDMCCDIYQNAIAAFDLSKYSVMQGIQYVDLEAMQECAIIVAFSGLDLHPSVTESVIYINQKDTPMQMVNAIENKLSDECWVKSSLDRYKKALDGEFSMDEGRKQILDMYAHFIY
jgi:glycosyltransferase involved in cell wall biosynthesis